MKLGSRFRVSLFPFALAAFLGPALDAATLVVSPAVVSNDFKGVLTLTISGVPAGGSAWVEKYSDANRNGVIDSGIEPLVQRVLVTDGVVPRIGGVRNWNVPGDEDGATNGQIRVELRFPGANQVLDGIAGNYLFRVYDPLTVFLPATNAFLVNQRPQAQGVTGTVVSAVGGAPVPFATVVLLVPNGGGLGAVADASGSFTLYSAPGDYQLLALRPGYVADGNGGNVSVNANAFISNTLAVMPSDRVISGRVSDATSGLGIGGIFINAEGVNGRFAITFTDASGAYAVPAVADDWRIKLDEESGLAQLGYVRINSRINTNTSSGSVSNIDFQFPKATAMIYGTVSDTASNLLSDIVLGAVDASNYYDSLGTSTGSGVYSIGVLGGPWNVSPNNDSLAARGYIGQGVTITATNGAATRQDFILQSATTRLSGRVIDSSGSPLSFFSMNITRFVGYQSDVSFYPQTDGDGNFDVGVFAGTWDIGLECGDLMQANLVGPRLTVPVVDGESQSNLLLIARPITSQITGTVLDVNSNPVPVSVFASATISGTNYSVCNADTDGGGHFQISVFDGTWTVGISGDLTGRGYANPANQMVVVSGGGATVNFILAPAGNQAAVLVNPSFANGQFRFRLNGATDQQYRIDATTNLGGTNNWIVLRTNTAFGGTFEFVDTNAPSNGGRFYRAVKVP